MVRCRVVLSFTITGSQNPNGQPLCSPRLAVLRGFGSSGRRRVGFGQSRVAQEAVDQDQGSGLVRGVFLGLTMGCWAPKTMGPCGSWPGDPTSQPKEDRMEPPRKMSGFRVLGLRSPGFDLRPVGFLEDFLMAQSTSSDGVCPLIGSVIGSQSIDRNLEKGKAFPCPCTAQVCFFPARHLVRSLCFWKFLQHFLNGGVGCLQTLER